MRRRLWPLVLASAVGLAILLSLGVWQVQRLAWKQELIAEVEQKMAAPAILVEPKLFEDKFGRFPPKLPEHTRVRAVGEFLGFEPYRFIATANGGPGWRLLHLFKANNGVHLYVDRGVLPEGANVPIVQGSMEIEGVINWHDKGYGFFDPSNDVANNRWYRWDWYELDHDSNTKLNIEARQPVGPFAVKLLPGSPGTEGLVVNPPKADLRNNHLGYAITWFGLAIVLAVMTAVLVWPRIRSG